MSNKSKEEGRGGGGGGGGGDQGGGEALIDILYVPGFFYYTKVQYFLFI